VIKLRFAGALVNQYSSPVSQCDSLFDNPNLEFCIDITRSLYQMPLSVRLVAALQDQHGSMVDHFALAG